MRDMKNTDTDKLYKKALDAGKKRNYTKAVQLLTELINETDSYPEAFLYLGRSYHALNRYESSIRTLRYYIKAFPESSAGYFFLGRSYLAYGLPKFAVIHLKKALEIYPDSARILSYLGISFLRIKRTDLALKYLGAAIEKDPDDTRIHTGYLNTLFMQAIKTFHRGNIDLSKQMFNFLWEKGNRGILINLYLGSIGKEEKSYDSALYHYDEAIKISPNDSLLRFRRATMLYHTGRRDEAVSELAELNITPDSESFSWTNEEINRFLAVKYYQQKHFRKAVFYGTRFLHADNSDIDMHLLAGECYRELGEKIKAKNHFLRSIELNRSGLEGRCGLGMILWQEERWKDMMKILKVIDRYDPGNMISSYYIALCKCKLNYPSSETIPSIQAEIRKSGPDAFLFTALGMQYIRDGSEDFSEKWFNKAIKLDQNHEAAHRGLIEVYNILHMKSKLTSAYSDYLKKFPENREFRGDYIHHLFEIQEYTDAAEEIEKHLLYKKDNSKYQRLLAISYRKSKMYNEASVVYRKLLRDDPGNQNYLESLVFSLDKSGKRSNALALLKGSFEYKNPTPNLLLIYGVLSFREENLEESLKSFREVLDISPKDWRAHKNIGLVYKRQGMDSFAEKYMKNSEKYRVGNK